MKLFKVKEGERKFSAWLALEPDGKVMCVQESKATVEQLRREWADPEIPLGAILIMRCVVTMEKPRGGQPPILGRYLKRRALELIEERKEHRKRMKEFPPHLSAPHDEHGNLIK